MPEAGYPLHRFAASGLPRRPSPALLRAVAGGRRAAGLPADHPPGAPGRRVRRRRLRVRPDAGRGRRPARLPAALLEVDAHMGLANRMAAPLVRPRVPALPDRGPAAAALPGHRASGAARGARTGARPRSSTRRRPIVLVFGGSLGATHASTRPPPAPGPGTIPASPWSTSPASASSTATGRPRPTATACCRTRRPCGATSPPADLVVSRAGGSVFEIAAAGKPSILVPSPNVTADHQTRNAEHFALGGAAVVVGDADLTADAAAPR